MWEAEQRFHPYLFYMHLHTELKVSMRPVLVDWLMEVAAEFGMGRETLYLALNFVDRFCSLAPGMTNNNHNTTTDDSPIDIPTTTTTTTIDGTTLQLLGITCLFVAAKLDEIHVPSLEVMATTTDGACSAANILKMERRVLAVLQWKLNAPTPYSWLNLFAQKAKGMLHDGGILDDQVEIISVTDNVDEAQRRLQVEMDVENVSSGRVLAHGMDLLDILAMDMHSLRFYPSHLAAAILFTQHPLGSRLHALIETVTTYRAFDLEPLLYILDVLATAAATAAATATEDLSSLVFDNQIATASSSISSSADERYTRQTWQKSALVVLQTNAALLEKLDVLCHTNVMRTIPAHLSEDTYAQLQQAGVLWPIRPQQTDGQPSKSNSLLWHPCDPQPPSPSQDLRPSSSSWGLASPLASMIVPAATACLEQVIQ